MAVGYLAGEVWLNLVEPLKRPPLKPAAQFLSTLSTRRSRPQAGRGMWCESPDTTSSAPVNMSAKPSIDLSSIRKIKVRFVHHCGSTGGGRLLHAQMNGAQAWRAGRPSWLISHQYRALINLQASANVDINNQDIQINNTAAGQLYEWACRQRNETCRNVQK